MTREKLLAIGLIVIACYFFLWQFDHTVAPSFWGNPLMHQKVIDGWFLDYLSGIDVYNSCVLMLIILFASIFVVTIIPFGNLYLNSQTVAVNKEVIIGFLLVLEAFIVPIVTHLNLTGKVPDRVQTLAWLLTAILIGITYFLKFLGYKKTEP